MLYNLANCNQHTKCIIIYSQAEALMKNNNLPVLSSESGLSRYLEEIKKLPMLTEEEEHALAVAWVENGDVIAAQKLVTSHLRLVAKLAQQYKGYGLPITDLISEGNVGLMIAVKKFDHTKGFRLATYAMWWIKAMIQDYILKSWSMVKFGTSATHKKLFFNLRKVRNKILHAHNGQMPHNEIELIAKELDVSQEDAQEMSDRFNQFESSLNDPSYDDSLEMIDTLADDSPRHDLVIIEDSDYKYKKRKFDDAFLLLNDREKDIIQSRRLAENPETLDAIGKRYGVSTERVRQIEEQALKKLTKYVQ